MAASPTPPAPAWISTRSPAFSPASSNDSTHVTNTDGIVASAVMGTPAGATATNSSCVTISGPNVPNAKPATRSPPETAVTAEPVSTIRPQNSSPSDPSPSTRPHGPEYVQEVEAAGFDRGAHLVRLQRTRRCRLHPQRLDRSSFVRRQHPVCVLRQRKMRRARTPPNQPGRLAAFLPIRDVVLRVGEQQLVGKDRLRLHRLRVEVKHPRPELGRLAPSPPFRNPRGRRRPIARCVPVPAPAPPG